MVQFIPPPDKRSLLPPLLACLPTALVSPRPPPALLPLLSPILSQRVQIHSAPASRSQSWLLLLSWNEEQAQRLLDIVESDRFELHPVSGEVEFKDAEPTRFRRLDEETLQAEIILKDLGLRVIYLWCTSDEERGSAEWKVAELNVDDGRGSHEEWHQSVLKADEAYSASKEARFLRVADAARDNRYSGSTSVDPNDDDDDDDYWQQYDRTPGRRESPNIGSANAASRPVVASDEEHYAQYSTVQPAMDSDEPPPPEEQNQARHERPDQPHANHPANPLSTQPGPVARLDEPAASRNVAEMGVKQHVSTSIKSLFRLSRTVGIERDEFHRLVTTELEVLSLMEAD
ncbi:MAG: hypothetical protein M1837_006533 [Sclerophora amabilis]|nr:MAG: hypothetical protein M1837_006533 [Sclerophora amabilis]